jgi:hypothetical protein
VPFARHRARHTRDFEDLVAWLVAHTDKTAVTKLCRINWRTTGACVLGALCFSIGSRGRAFDGA